MYYEEPQESILNWIKPEVHAAVKPARYQSKFKGTTDKLVGSTFGVKTGGKGGTFGRSVKDTINPGTFLKGREKIGSGIPSSKPGKFHRATATKKPALPSKKDRPVYGLKSSKNFVVANAVENILAAPKPGKAMAADYLHKEDFGKVPAYLHEVKAEIAAEDEFVRGMLEASEETGGGPRLSELPDSEREDLLEALKAKWDEVNKAYQLITFKRISSSNSTTGAIRRKEDCERQLAELERDIERLSGRGPVLVVED